jgi:hypothetical protein
MESVKEAKKIAADLAEIKKHHSIKPGSPEMEAYLAAGYAPDIMNREQAELIIADWKKDHSSSPYPIYRKALAYLAALNAKPEDAFIFVHPSLENPDITHTSPGR